MPIPAKILLNATEVDILTIIEEMMNVKDNEDAKKDKKGGCGCGCSAEEVNAKESMPLNGSK